MDINDFINETPLWLLILMAVSYGTLVAVTVWTLIRMFRK